MPDFYTRFEENLNGLDRLNLIFRVKYYCAQNGVDLAYQVNCKLNQSYMRFVCKYRSGTDDGGHEEETEEQVMVQEDMDLEDVVYTCPFKLNYKSGR
jgi:hypothetical protein